MYKKFLILLFAIALAGAGCSNVGSNSTASNEAALTMPNGKTITVEVARTLSEQATGLSERKDVSPGMLFCMGKTKVQNFWMLGMKAPIDMIWIHGGDVMEVSANVPLREDGEVTRRSSMAPANMVLELPAGEAEKFDVNIDTFIEGAVEACG